MKTSSFSDSGQVPYKYLHFLLNSRPPDLSTDCSIHGVLPKRESETGHFSRAGDSPSTCLVPQPKLDESAQAVVYVCAGRDADQGWLVEPGMVQVGNDFCAEIKHQ